MCRPFEGRSGVLEEESLLCQVFYRDISQAGKELNSGIIIYPVASAIDGEIKRMVEQDEQPLVVTAEQTVPMAAPIDVL